MCRQSMHTKATPPGTLERFICASEASRKEAKASGVISPAAITNSRCRTSPNPETLPSMATL